MADTKELLHLISYTLDLHVDAHPDGFTMDGAAKDVVEALIGPGREAYFSAIDLGSMAARIEELEAENRQLRERLDG